MLSSLSSTRLVDWDKSGKVHGLSFVFSLTLNVCKLVNPDNASGETDVNALLSRKMDCKLERLAKDGMVPDKELR